MKGVVYKHWSRTIKCCDKYWQMGLYLLRISYWSDITFISGYDVTVS